MEPDYMVRYEIEDISQSYYEDTITIGFATAVKNRMMMGIWNNDTQTPEYIYIVINNNGRFLSY